MSASQHPTHSKSRSRPPDRLHRINGMDAVGALMAAMRTTTGMRSDTHVAGDLLSELARAGFYLGVADRFEPIDFPPEQDPPGGGPFGF